MIPIRNKPTRVTNKTARAVDHILTNSYTETIFKTAILKFDVSDQMFQLPYNTISKIFIEE